MVNGLCVCVCDGRPDKIEDRETSDTSRVPPTAARRKAFGSWFQVPGSRFEKIVSYMSQHPNDLYKSKMCDSNDNVARHGLPPSSTSCRSGDNGRVGPRTHSQLKKKKID